MGSVGTDRQAARLEASNTPRKHPYNREYLKLQIVMVLRARLWDNAFGALINNVNAGNDTARRSGQPGSLRSQ
jgi:hypothetical protein